MDPSGGPRPGWSPPPPPPSAPGWSTPPSGPGGPVGYPVGPPPPKRFGTGALVGAGLGGAVFGGIVAVVALVVIGLLIGPLIDGPVRGTYGPRPEGATDPGVGDCLSGRPSLVAIGSAEEIVPCADRHGSEVIGLVTIPDLSNRPRGEALDRFVSEACGLHLRAYVGSSPDSTRLEYGGVVPDVAAWRAGDRGVWCLIDSSGHRDGVGSARGSGS